MAAGKTSQSNTSLVAMVVFIVLFLICAIIATIFYTKFEDEKALKLAAQEQANKLANSSERSKLDSQIVGKPRDNKSYIATMAGFLDEMVRTVTGEVPDTTAATKINQTKIRINETVEKLGEDATAAFGKEDFNLLYTIETLKTKLEEMRKQAANLDARINDLQEKINIIQNGHRKEIANFEAKVEQANSERNNVLERYNMLESLMTDSVNEQVQLWADKLEAAKTENKEQQEAIAGLNGNIEDLTGQLKEALDILDGFKSEPNKEVLAHKADAKVHTADARNGLVYLNKGKKDRVYIGLTFSIFDRNASIPEDGKGKAEVEVFRVEENSCVAKILTSDPKDPILVNDIAVNMIWDSKKSNSFMLVGEFDFDGDGIVDSDGREKIARLIHQWGGKIVDKLTVNTNFLVVGAEPEEMKKPTEEHIMNYPGIEEKYEKSKVDVKIYNELLQKAKLLSVPVFNRDRFLNLVGYETAAAKSTPSYKAK